MTAHLARTVGIGEHRDAGVGLRDRIVRVAGVHAAPRLVQGRRRARHERDRSTCPVRRNPGRRAACSLRPCSCSAALLPPDPGAAELASRQRPFLPVTTVGLHALAVQGRHSGPCTLQRYTWRPVLDRGLALHPPGCKSCRTGKRPWLLWKKQVCGWAAAERVRPGRSSASCVTGLRILGVAGIAVQRLAPVAQTGAPRWKNLVSLALAAAFCHG